MINMDDLRRYLLTAHRDDKHDYHCGDMVVERAAQNLVEWPLTREQLIARLGELEVETETRAKYDAEWENIEIFELPPADYEGEKQWDYVARVREGLESLRDEGRARVAPALAARAEAARLADEARQREAQRLADVARAAQAEAERARLAELVAKHPETARRALGLKP